MTKKQIIDKIGVAYYLREREDVHEDMFEPMSKSQWILFREISLGKISKNYDAYVEDCNRRYLEELERRKESGAELTSVAYNLQYDLECSLGKINEIENAEWFINWVDPELINEIRNFKNIIPNNI